jgi:aromatic ring-opening dioxygenase catalytic subunit (LigB family)
MPALFVSHGSPLMAIEDSAARRFLAALGPRLPRPEAVVVFSAHHDRPCAEITAAPHPPTIHDFGGFPAELYRIAYPAPGDPPLAERIATRLGEAGIDARLERRRGFDQTADAITAARYDDLLEYRRRAPHATENHPTPEHFLPLFAALGAAYDEERGARLHTSYDRGLLAVDTYAFGFDRFLG